MHSTDIHTADKPTSSAAAPACDKVLHWGIIYMVLSLATLLVYKITQRMILSVVLAPALYGSFSAQIVFGVLYTGETALNILGEMLFIRLTYRRFSYSKVWKAFVLLEIVSVPIFLDVNGLMQTVQDALRESVLASPGLIVFNVLLSVIPLVYFFWAVRKAEDDPLNRPAPAAQSDMGEAPEKKRMHWLLAAGITLVASFLLFNWIGNVDTPITEYINTDNLYKEALTVIYYRIVIAVLMGFCLWIGLTNKRYAHTVNWQVGSLLALFSLILMFFYIMVKLAKNVTGDLYNYLGISRKMAERWGVAPFGFSPLHLLMALILALLPLWYFWRSVQKAGGCPLLPDKWKPAEKKPQADG